ncbi:hypothetical protein [Tardiphaga sp. OK245]|uniref:hypothetical protein n=1 Tax=Tardiphaga sp. OK245 TaxID=1855306 RepID=UPI0008A74F9D|nr:hypothetical protein [Tardiphaga sp. OK245]SEH80039.1 hypothetical protein SAMN05216367_2048 [Tardiphaga sp. OK245]
MLRFKILASTIPLALAAFLARGDLVSGTHPCISTGETTVQIAVMPWQARSHVSFTNDPLQATVRVQIVDSAETADFVVLDDADAAEPDACPVTAATRFIGIAETSATSEPIIYLSEQGDADYRIFVKSRSFTARDAAALIVGAHSRSPARMAAANL